MQFKSKTYIWSGVKFTITLLDNTDSLTISLNHTGWFAHVISRERGLSQLYVVQRDERDISPEYSYVVGAVNRCCGYLLDNHNDYPRPEWAYNCGIKNFFDGMPDGIRGANARNRKTLAVTRREIAARLLMIAGVKEQTPQPEDDNRKGGR